MSNIVPYGGGGRLSRTVGQQLVRSEERALVAAGDIRRLVFVTQVALDGAGSIVGRQIGHIAQYPEAEAALRKIGQTGLDAIALRVAEEGLL